MTKEEYENMKEEMKKDFKKMLKCNKELIDLKNDAEKEEDDKEE